MKAFILQVHLQPIVIIEFSMIGGNKITPSPEPETDKPDAKESFFWKYVDMMIVDETYKSPSPEPNRILALIVTTTIIETSYLLVFRKTVLCDTH